ncbi:MAG: methyltransferase domain-containing protein [Rickettsiales bacterium]
MNSGGEFPEFRPDFFARQDEMPDEMFYSMPRLVTHIDDEACAALAGYYATLLKEGDVVLDLMSSCVSHLPRDAAFGKVIGHGMNRTELEANPQLDEYFLQNLNKTPDLPFEAASFDACLIAVSVQYLSRPVEVFAEIARILKPGGVLAASFSNRMFPTKAIALWQALGDTAHGELVCEYARRAGGFDEPIIRDLSPNPGRSDPLYAVEARAAARA